MSDTELQTLRLGAPVGSPDDYMFQGSGPEVYLVEKGQWRWLTSPARVEDYGGFHRVIRIADENLRSLPLGALVGVAPDGVLFKDSGPKVYVMEGGGGGGSRIQPP